MGTAFALLLMAQRSVVYVKTAERCTALRDAPDDTAIAVRVSICCSETQKTLRVLQMSFERGTQHQKILQHVTWKCRAPGLPKHALFTANALRIKMRMFYAIIGNCLQYRPMSI